MGTYEGRTGRSARVDELPATATDSTEGLVTLNKYFSWTSAGSFNDTNNGQTIGTISNIPAGTYKVIVGATEFASSTGVDGVAGLLLRMNGGDFVFGNITNPFVGFGSRLTTDDSDSPTLCQTYFPVTFPNPTNSFHLLLSIQSGSVIFKPYYILEKIDNSLVFEDWT
jgi:hypothetical protein